MTTTAAPHGSHRDAVAGASASAPAGSGDGELDPRGPRSAAAVTSVVLAAVLVLGSHPAGVALLTVQTVLFAWAVVAGVARTPQAWAFRRLVRPHLGPPAHTEPPQPPRFAQGVGLAFALVGLVGLSTGLTTLGLVAVGAALTAALLNAVLGLCLGCEAYLLLRRATAAVT